MMRGLAGADDGAHSRARGHRRYDGVQVRLQLSGREPELTEIRDLLTVYHEIVRSGKQKKLRLMVSKMIVLDTQNDV